MLVDLLVQPLFLFFDYSRLTLRSKLVASVMLSILVSVFLCIVDLYVGLELTQLVYF